jgi:hypothetical protein
MAFHFSFNPNKLWTNWRSKWLFYTTNQYFRQSDRQWKPMFFPDRIDFYRICPLDWHVWESLVTFDTQAHQTSHLRYFRSPRPILLARTVTLVAKFEDCQFYCLFFEIVI